MTQTYYHKLQTLAHIIAGADSFLLVAHRRPDPDAIGATTALARYILSLGKQVVIVCHDEVPSDLMVFTDGLDVRQVKDVDISQSRVIIGCDNVDRGFDSVLAGCTPEQVTVAIDHHQKIKVSPDLVIARQIASSTCEILCDFFESSDVVFTSEVAKSLLVGILGDTRIFHNPNTTPHVLDAVAGLTDVGAPLAQIVDSQFTQQSIPTLRLWGRALSNTVTAPSGAIVAAITHEDLRNIDMPTEDVKECVKEVASLLCAIQNVPFAMLLLEMDNGMIKASLRSENDRGVDTAAISQTFGGGGHRLASGFEVFGSLVRKNNVWQVV